MAQSFQQLLDELKSRGEELGVALAREQELEDDRAAVKADAIVRVMKRDGLAATPAEKIVETDEQYFAHRAAQRTSIVARFKADAAYQAAKAAATQASLSTPAMVELQRMSDELLTKNQENARTITDLETKLKMSKRQTDLNEIALRRANKFLSHRIDDVDHLSESVLKLTSENKNLREGILAPPTEVVPVGAWATLDESRESLIAEPYSAEGAPQS